MASSSSGGDCGMKYRKRPSTSNDTKVASKGSKANVSDPAVSVGVDASSVAPAAKKAKLEEPEEAYGDFVVVPTRDWPSVPSFTANTVKELLSNLPNDLTAPILVDTAESEENWDQMIDAEDGIYCSVVWHDGKMFIVEFPTRGHEYAVGFFVDEVMATNMRLPAAQQLTRAFATSMEIHHPNAQPTFYNPDYQWRFNNISVLVLEVGWTQTWDSLLAKAEDYLTCTNGSVKLVALVKIFPELGVPLYTPGTPQPAAAVLQALPMQAAVASMLHQQFFVSHIIKFGIGQRDHAHPSLRLPFRRLYPAADQVAVINALGQNPHIDLTTMRTRTEEAYMAVVRAGDVTGQP